MKNRQKGFVVPLLLGFIVLMVIGGGVYLYGNKKFQEKGSTLAQNVVLKEYIHSSNIYSLKYPDDWKYVETNPQVTSFSTVTSEEGKFINIAFDVDIDNIQKILLKLNTSKDVTFGANKFTEYTRIESDDPFFGAYKSYLLNIGEKDGQSVFLVVQVNTAAIDTDTLSMFLSSIKVNSSMIANIVEKDKQKSIEISSAIDKLKIEDKIIGTGAEAKIGHQITVNYIGTLENGKKFDSSYDRGQSFIFTLGMGQVIKGWDQGIVGMKVGGKRKLIIPAALAYGNQATGDIPANSTLVFEVELISVKDL